MQVGFWFNNHPMTPMAERLYEKFIPASGSTSFVEAEVLRGVNRLHHDYFNNGFGNNMSQAVAYVEKYYLGRATPHFYQAFEAIKEQALAPTGDNGLDEYFNTVMAEVLINLSSAEQNETLTPIVETLDDMPRVETIYAEQDDEEEEDEDDNR